MEFLERYDIRSLNMFQEGMLLFEGSFHSMGGERYIAVKTQEIHVTEAV